MTEFREIMTDTEKGYYPALLRKAIALIKTGDTITIQTGCNLIEIAIDELEELDL